MNEAEGHNRTRPAHSPLARGCLDAKISADAVRDRLWARLRAGDFADDDLGSLFGDLDAGATDPAEAVSKE